jgi:hypothetical protein
MPSGVHEVIASLDDAMMDSSSVALTSGARDSRRDARVGVCVAI